MACDECAVELPALKHNPNVTLHIVIGSVRS